MMTTADMRRAALLNDSVQDVRDCESRAVPAASPDRRRHCHCAAAWLGMMALAGCTTVGPDFVPPKAPVPAQWQEPDSTVVTQQPAEQIRWWEGFHDPVLSRLIDTAYQNNYSLKIAGLRVLQARAQLGIAVGYLYPQVQQANGGVKYTSASKNAANTEAGDLGFWEYNVGVSVGWELDFWGKFRRSIEAADANLMASVAGYDNALVLLVAQVADTYVAIRSAEAQLQVARENIALQQRSVRITEARYRGGDVGELDVLQARTQLLGTQATIPPLETGLEQAKNALSTLLGQPPGGLAEILGPQQGVIPAAPQAIAAGAPTDLLRRRPGCASGGTRCRNAKRSGGGRRGRSLSELRVERISRRGGRRRHEHHAHRQQRLRSTFQHELPRVRRRAVLQLEHPELRAHPQQRPGQRCRSSSNCWRTTRARCSTR